jgi:hypothetical protein
MIDVVLKLFHPSFRWTPDSSNWTRPMGIPARTPATSRKMRIRTNRTWGLYNHQPIPLTLCFCHIVSPRQCVFFCNLTEKKTARFAFAGRWIGLTIANYIVNRWKQTLINTNWKITDKPASSRFILGVVVWASDILLVRSENMEEHMNSASNNGIWTKTNSIQHSNPIGWSSSNVLPGLVNFFLHNELERKSPFKEWLNQHKSTISPCSIAIWMYV